MKDDAREAVSKEGAHQVLVSRYNALKADYNRLLKVKADLDAQAISNRALKEEVEELRTRERAMAQKASASEARVGCLQERLSFASADNRRLREEVERLREETAASKGRGAGSRYNIHLACSGGKILEQPLIYNDDDLDSSTECYLGGGDGVSCHHLQLRLSNGSVSLKASRVKKRYPCKQIFNSVTIAVLLIFLFLLYSICASQQATAPRRLKISLLSQVNA